MRFIEVCTESWTRKMKHISSFTGIKRDELSLRSNEGILYGIEWSGKRDSYRGANKGKQSRSKIEEDVLRLIIPLNQ